MQVLDIYILLSTICWGGWGIADKKALEFAKQEDVIARLYVFAFLLILPVFLVINAIYPNWSFSVDLFLWTGCAALCYTIALIAYIEAMSMTEASFVLAITAAYPLVLQFLAALFLQEKFLFQRMIGALVIGFGLFFISLSAEKKHLVKESVVASSRRFSGTFSHLNPALIFCVILATFCWGLFGLFDKKALFYGPPLLAYVCQKLWDIPLFILVLLYFKIRGKLPKFQRDKSWIYCGLSQLLLALGAMAYLAALAMSTASYVVTITGCYPMLMYLFAILFLKETFNKRRFFGIILVVCGGALVQISPH